MEATVREAQGRRVFVGSPSPFDHHTHFEACYHGAYGGAASTAVTVAGLFATRTLAAESEGKGEAKTVKCVGVNACKGQSAWKGAGHDCAGKNSCKGQGSLKTTAEDCKAKGGKVES